MKYQTLIVILIALTLASILTASKTIVIYPADGPTMQGQPRPTYAETWYTFPPFPSFKL